MADVNGGVLIQRHLSLVHVVVIVIVQAKQRGRHCHVILSADRLVHKHLQDVTESEWGTVIFKYLDDSHLCMTLAPDCDDWDDRAAADSRGYSNQDQEDVQWGGKCKDPLKKR